MSNKEAVIEAVRGLPDEATLDEIAEHVAILAAIRRGEEDIAAGCVVSQAELDRRILAAIQKGLEASAAGRVISHDEVKRQIAASMAK